MLRCVTRPHVLGGALVVAMLLPLPARAWTDAGATSARAHVDVLADGTARVRLEVDIHVRGGWLESFELDGLTPPFELVADAPPTALGEDGKSYSVEPRRTRDGALELRFGRRDGPRRGRLTLTVTYATTLVPTTAERLDPDRLRIFFTLPAWTSGLDDVRVALRTPGHAAPVVLEPELALATSTARDAEATTTTYERVHLPRATAWTLAVDADAAAFSAPLPTLVAPPVVARPVDRPTGRLGFGLLLAWVLGVSLFARSLVTRHAVRTGFVVRGAIVQRTRAALVLATVAGIAASWLSPWSFAVAYVLAMLSIMAIAWTRRSLGPRADLGAWRASTASDLRQARRQALRHRLGFASPFDVTTPVGLGFWLIAAAPLAALRIEPLPPDFEASSLALLALLAFPAVAYTRSSRPNTPLERLARLERFAASLRVHRFPFALALALHERVDGSLQEARLRVVHPRRPDGLVRLDFAVADVYDRGGIRSEIVLVVVARAGSRADVALANALPELAVEVGPGLERVVRVVPRCARFTQILDTILRVVDEAAIERRTRSPIAATRERSEVVLSAH